MRNAQAQLLFLRDTGASCSEISNLLKDQVKKLCITSEIIFTMKYAENNPNSNFLYSCSALLDSGVSSYLNDDDWQLLVRTMGFARKKHGCYFKRVFLVEEGFLNSNELNSLNNIVQLHLINGVNVDFVLRSSLSQDEVIKSNMAWIGGITLLHATDQIRWDLDISGEKSSILEARQKHQVLQDKAIISIDEARRKRKLNELRYLVSSNSKSKEVVNE